jgi:hypothetical protein
MFQLLHVSRLELLFFLLPFHFKSEHFILQFALAILFQLFQLLQPLSCISQLSFPTFFYRQLLSGPSDAARCRLHKIVAVTSAHLNFVLSLRDLLNSIGIHIASS